MLVFELKEGRLNLCWERFRLWEMFRKEIRSNEELIITLSICTIAFGVGTDVSNKWYRKIRSFNSEKSRQYFERNLLFAFCSLF